MTQPYKICPACGQPAVVEMPQCRRCGYLYSPAAGLAAQPGAGPHGRPEGYAPPGARPIGRLLVPLVLLAVITAGIGTLALRRAHPRDIAPLAGAAAASKRAGGLEDPTSSLFVERDSGKEMPSIHVTNEDNDRLHLALRSESGQTYTLDCDPGATETLQVPSGRYAVMLTSDSPRIRPNSGDAVFRRFKDYSARFVESTDMSPVHLGD